MEYYCFGIYYRRKCISIFIYYKWRFAENSDWFFF